MSDASVIDLEDESRGVAIAADLKEHFARIPGWDFECHLSEGNWGVVVRIKKNDVSSGRIKRLAVKRALGNGDEEDQLRNEIQWMKKLRGAEHIVKIVAARDDINEGDARNGSWRRIQLSWLGRLLPKPADHYLRGLTGPVVAMEYLENGSWFQVMKRAQDHGTDLPNRLLWSLFLCCLAYPIGSKEGVPTQLETIPADGSAPSTIEHGDLHLGNLMMGSADGRFPEHAIAPVAKFIDLGSMKENIGVAEHIMKIGTRMLNMILRDHPRYLLRKTVTYNGFETHAFSILPAAAVGQRRQQRLPVPLLDPELRDIIARCMAKQEADRPTLPDVLRVAENAVRKTAASYAPNEARETDEAVAEVVRQVIYNAPAAPSPPAPRGPEPVPDPDDPGLPYCFGCFGLTWDINGGFVPM